MANNRLMRCLMMATAAVAFSSVASADTMKKPAMCVVVGMEVEKTKDMACPKDVIGTLRSHVFKYEVAKLDKKGMIVVDKKGDPVMEPRQRTYKIMADLLAAAGLKKMMGDGLATVFAVSDDVLGPMAKDLAAMLKDKDKKQAVATAALMHVIDEALKAEWFRSSNGKIWTYAGGWGTGMAPLGFYALRDHTTVEINGVPLAETDILASNGVIHTVDSALIALPKMEKKEKMADG